jgi:hypothetical protein
MMVAFIAWQSAWKANVGLSSGGDRGSVLYHVRLLKSTLSVMAATAPHTDLLRCTVFIDKYMTSKDTVLAQ